MVSLFPDAGTDNFKNPVNILYNQILTFLQGFYQAV